MTSRRPLVGRIVVGAIVPIAMILVTVLPLVRNWDRLPARLATHWRLDGVADGSMSPPTTALFSAAPVGISVLVLIVIAIRRAPRAQWAVGAAALAGIIGATFAVVGERTIALNVGQSDWRQVAGPSIASVAAIVAGGLLTGAIVARAASIFAVPEPRPAPATPIAAQPTTKLTWFKTNSSRSLIIISAVVVTAGLGLVVVGPLRWPGLGLLVIGLVISLLSTITVRADRRGLSIAYGPLHLIRQRIPLERIASASAIDVRPMEWGGWGYRGSLRLFRRAAVVLRRGPGVRLDLRDGTVFVVTTDDAAIAAAVLNRFLGSAVLGSAS